MMRARSGCLGSTPRARAPHYFDFDVAALAIVPRACQFGIGARLVLLVQAVRRPLPREQYAQRCGAQLADGGTMACLLPSTPVLSKRCPPSDALPDEQSRYHTMQVLCTEHMHVALTNLTLQRTQLTIIATHCSSQGAHFPMTIS